MRDVIDVQTPSLMAKIIAVTANECGVSERAFKSRMRTERYVRPRRIAAYLCREHTDNSSPAIARAMGRKDHTTVLHHANVVRERLKVDPVFATQIGLIELRLGL